MGFSSRCSRSDQWGCGLIDRGPAVAPASITPESAFERLYDALTALRVLLARDRRVCRIRYIVPTFRQDRDVSVRNLVCTVLRLQTLTT